MTSPITTHVLDTHLGQPAAGMTVELFRQTRPDDTHHGWERIAEGVTNTDGRITDWLAGQPRQAGLYRIRFHTDPYFAKQGLTCFYPCVTLDFRLTEPQQHYHVPLLISAHGVSSYRGS